MNRSGNKRRPLAAAIHLTAFLLLTASQLVADSATIEGTVFGWERRRVPQRLPYPGIWLILLRVNSGPGDHLQEVARTNAGSDGKYSFKGIAPGKYVVRTLGPDHPVNINAEHINLPIAINIDNLIPD